MYSVYGTAIHITPYMAIMVASIVFTLTISTILSDRPDMAIKHLIIYSGAVFIGIAFSGYDIWLIVIYSAILHSIFICVPMASSNSGYLGNSNFAGAFLAPCVLIALHINQPLAALLFALVLYKTRCKGAVLGLIIGALFISPLLSIFFIIVYLPLFFEIKSARQLPSLGVFNRLRTLFRKTKQINTVTLKVRLNMWKSSLKIFL